MIAKPRSNHDLPAVRTASHPGFNAIFTTSICENVDARQRKIDQPKIIRHFNSSEKQMTAEEVCKHQCDEDRSASLCLQTTTGDATTNRSLKCFLSCPVFFKRYVDRLIRSQSPIKISKNELDTELRLFPARFRDLQNEKAYEKKCRRAFWRTLRVFSLLTSLPIAIMWALVAARTSVYNTPAMLTIDISGTGYYSKIGLFPMYSQEGLILFHCASGFSLIGLLTLALFEWIPVVRNHVEILTYFVFEMSMLLWVAMDATALAISTPHPSTASIDLSYYYAYKLWSDSFVFLIFIIPLFSVNFFLPTKTSRSWIFHIVYIATIASDYIASAIRFRMFQNSIGLGALQSVCVIVTGLVAFIGGYIKELVNRLYFYQLITHQKTLNRLEDEIHKPSDGQNKSQLEEINTLLSKAKLNLRTGRLKNENSYLELSEELIEACRTMMLRSQDVYAVRFDANSSANEGAKFWTTMWTQQFSDSNRSVQPSDSSRQRAEFMKERRQSIANFQCRSATLPNDRMTTWTSKLPPLITEQIGRSLDFNVFASCHNISAIVEVGSFLLFPTLTDLKVQHPTLTKLLQTIADLYEECVPYHNGAHGAHVAHTAVYLARRCESLVDNLSTAEYAAYVVAAVSHDIAHPGRTNEFLRDRYDPLAVIYNDQSVLENYHSCLTLKALNRSGCELFWAVSSNNFRALRGRIIELILSTDMRYHFQELSRYRLRIQKGSLSDSPIDVWSTLKMCLKAADVSHGVLEWPMHLQWSMLIAHEFYMQGDEEIWLGLKPKILYDRSQHTASFASGQKGFLELIVAPLYETLSDASGIRREDDECLKNIARNITVWTQKEVDKEVVELPTLRNMKKHCQTRIDLLCYDFNYLNKLTDKHSPGSHNAKKRTIVECNPDLNAWTGEVRIMKPSPQLLTMRRHSETVGATPVSMFLQNQGSDDVAVSRHTSRTP